MGRLAVRVTPDALRQIRGGHPWVFDEAVRSARPTGGAADGSARPGDLAVVFDDRRRFAAVGLWDPGSPIRIRVLHRGEPTPIDRDWFRARMRDAADLRAELETAADTTGYRLLNGENDGLPGLVLDRYADTLVLKLYSRAWFAHIEDVLAAIVERHRPARVVLRLARIVQSDDQIPSVGPSGVPLEDGALLLGDPPDGPVIFEEGALRFEADVIAGQKTGFFLDQRDNRAEVRKLSRRARVLDVYSSSGGFSVNAAAGGATLVHSVDISPGAIDAAERNMSLNRGRPEVARCEHRTSVGDAMEVMAALGRAGERFDVVVVDPPSFAAKQRQVEGALRAYGRLTELAVALLRPGGTLVQASCSARVPADAFVERVQDEARRAGTELLDLRVTGHAIDHPIGFSQGAYLKAVFARVPRPSRPSRSVRRK